MNFPLVTARIGSFPLRCIYTNGPIQPGQLVAQSPLGLISLMPIGASQQPLPAEIITYGAAVLIAFAQRQGWLPVNAQQLRLIASQLLDAVRSSIPDGESRYVHQLFQQIDLVPILLDLIPAPSQLTTTAD